MNDLDVDLATLARALRAYTVAVVDPNGRGAGSGIVWAADLVLTNAHVVRAPIALVESDGVRRRARTIRLDRELDLALLRVEGGIDGRAPALLRDSRGLVPGELLFAAGNPHGVPGVVTAGLLHRVNPRWVVASVRLAPGNSGGPLVDASGRVAGVNSMVARGMAIAIPSALAVRFVAGADSRAA